MPGDVSGCPRHRPLGSRPRGDHHGRRRYGAEAHPRAALRDGGSCRSGHGRAGHLDPAQGVAQKGDRLDGAREWQKSEGGRNEGAGAGGVIGANATNGNEQ
jgi:hypothetical protein